MPATPASTSQGDLFGGPQPGRLHRLFFALVPSAGEREGLRHRADDLKAAFPQARWVRPERYHLTLHFLGESDGPREDMIRNAGDKAPAVSHQAEQPVVRTHPETGRKSLFVNVAHTSHFKGMTEAESASILNFLFQHQVRPEFTCRYRWRKGSLAFWDNRATQHNPINDYHGYRRRMRRITLAGERPR